MSAAKSGQHRKDIHPGLTVDVILKKAEIQKKVRIGPELIKYIAKTKIIA